MSNYYKQEDLDSALSEFLVSPYANDDTQFSCGAKDALKLLRDIVNENVPDCLKIPAADVRENVRGEWQNVVVRNKGDDVLQAIESVASMQCPKCERWHNEVYLYGNPTEMSNFCPNCGADLRKEDKHGL